jgi:hypothetical protein
MRKAFMLMRNFERMAIMLTRVRIFLAKRIAQAAFISITFNALQLDGQDGGCQENTHAH